MPNQNGLTGHLLGSIIPPTPAQRQLGQVASADTLRATPPTPQNWALPHALPVGEVGLLVGADGAGKSFLALELAISVACGLPWAGGLLPAPVPGKVVYITGEESLDEIQRRVHAIADQITLIEGNRQWEAGLHQLKIVALDGEMVPLVTAQRFESGGSETCNMQWFDQQIAAARLWILDPLVMFHNLDESNNSHQNFLMRSLIRATRRAGTGAGVIVHHAGQDTIRSRVDDHTAGRGGTALHAAARAVFVVRRLNSREEATAKKAGWQPNRYRIVRGPKISRGPEREPAWCAVTDGVLWKITSPGSAPAGKAAKAPAPVPDLGEVTGDDD